MAKLPYFPFFPSDWLSDEKLRLCSIAARGLWIDMLSLMWKNDRRGYLQVAGKPVTAEQLARMTGCFTDEVDRLLAELKTSGVLSHTDDGVPFSRRIVRDDSLREARSKAGQKGGKASVLLKQNLKQTVKQSSSKRSSKVQASESESESESNTLSPPAASEGENEPPPEENHDPPGFADWYDAYPVKVARGGALKAFKKLAPPPELVATMIGAIRQQTAWRISRQQAGAFVPEWKHPATWLNNRCWEDETVSAVSTSPPEANAERDARILADRKAHADKVAAVEAARQGVTP